MSSSAGSMGGVARWLRASNSFESYRHDTADPSSLPSDRIRTLAVDRRGQLWVGTRNAGLARFDEATKTFVRHRHDPSDPSSLSDDHVYAIAEDHSGAIWVGTDAGINLVKIESRPTRHESWSHFFFIDLEGHMEDGVIEMTGGRVGLTAQSGNIDLEGRSKINVAGKDYGISGRPTNASRVSILTGLTRREVKKQRDLLAAG